LPPITAGFWPKAFHGSRTRFCVVSFTSDWLFPTSDSRAIVHALNASDASVSFVEIETDKGHDAFCSMWRSFSPLPPD
jgi:homoserine O-acetyltransferase